MEAIKYEIETYKMEIKQIEAEIKMLQEDVKNIRYPGLRRLGVKYINMKKAKIQRLQQKIEELENQLYGNQKAGGGESGFEEKEAGEAPAMETTNQSSNLPQKKHKSRRATNTQEAIIMNRLANSNIYSFPSLNIYMSTFGVYSIVQRCTNLCKALTDFRGDSDD